MAFILFNMVLCIYLWYLQCILVTKNSISSLSSGKKNCKSQPSYTYSVRSSRFTTVNIRNYYEAFNVYDALKIKFLRSLILLLYYIVTNQVTGLYFIVETITVATIVF